MATADQAAAVASVTAYSTATTALRAHLTAFLGSLWRSLPGYRDADMASFVQSLLPVLQGAEQQMVALTTGYLASAQRGAVGGFTAPVRVPVGDVTGAATRNGTVPADVYERPFHQIWTDLSNGVDPQTAIDRGLARAESLVATDLQRTKALTSQRVLHADEYAGGWRRVLEGTHSCGLCIVASTRRYHKADLMPVHPGCDCDVAPIYGTTDPGHIVNKGLLQDVHAAIEERFGVSDSAATNYHDLIVTHEHGELGPVLARTGDHFTVR